MDKRAPKKHPNKSPVQKVTIADVFAASRALTSGSQDGGVPSSPDTTTTFSADATATGRPPQPDMAWILSIFAEVKTYLVGKIVRSTGVLRGEIQTLGAWTVQVEQRLVATMEVHNEVVSRINSLKARLDSAELAIEDVGNRSRPNNVRIRGLPEHVGDGPLVDMVVSIFKPLLTDIPENLWHEKKA
ncbi:Hypothetical predicted protein [Pelobates cultripes]|uniref:Uncharacterized protein n=1 Tax=Pelobates cultripes TaxID=61616 RepID=A0AAD1W2J4_PELCU|nr:Hypothetical predicted protein [Pelobates cultripes]